MRSLRARRVKIKLGDFWESPALRVLLTKEDDVIVSRCLDFTVSSHGLDEKQALESLANSVKYILTAVKNDTIDKIYDPGHGKYWRMYNELESKQTIGKMKKALKKTCKTSLPTNIQDSSPEIQYA